MIQWQTAKAQISIDTSIIFQIKINTISDSSLATGFSYFGFFGKGCAGVSDLIVQLRSFEKSRTKIINDPEAFLQIEYNNNINKDSKTRRLLDIILAMYPYNETEIIDSVEVWQIFVKDSNKIFSSNTAHISDVDLEALMSKSRRLRNKGEEIRRDSILAAWDKQKADSSYVKELKIKEKKRRQDSILTSSNSLEKSVLSLNNYSKTSLQQRLVGSIIPHILPLLMTGQFELNISTNSG
ncbi:MAG: hypothetical protein HC817_05890 [Saprospiraceae bacterium]|nr:hypothetical protein [Saprospiraceae bacterium]